MSGETWHRVVHYKFTDSSEWRSLVVIEAVRSFGTSVHFYQITRCHFLEIGHNLSRHQEEISHNVKVFGKSRTLLNSFRLFHSQIDNNIQYQGLLKYETVNCGRHWQVLATHASTGVHRYSSLLQWSVSLGQRGHAAMVGRTNTSLTRVCGKNLNIVSLCAVSPVVHTSNICSCQKKKLFQFSCCCEQFHLGRSIGFLVIFFFVITENTVKRPV
jgi:hypothetical protein